MKQIGNYLRKQFALDLRSLSLMRVLIASVLILDIVIRLSDLKAHYTNEGVLPLNVLFERLWNEWLFSIHAISGNIVFQLFLFLVELLAAIALLAGYKTRPATIISWVMLVSVHNRNPLILQGGDDLLRMILFWGMFIPWGSYYSIDSKKGFPADHRFFNAAVLGYMIQVGAVYFFSAMLKTSPEWRTENTALYYALSLDQLVMPAGKLIYPYYEMLKVFTFLTFRIEFWIPVLLLYPFLGIQFRNIAAIIFIMLHLGIGFTLFVGLFFLIGISSSVGLLGGKLADRIHNKLLGKPASTELQKIHPSFQHSHINLVLSAVLGYVILWNIETTKYFNFQIPVSAKAPAYAFRLNQCWGMFSPGVFKDDGWYIFEGITTKKDTIDLNRFGLRSESKKPEHVVSLFRNDRWRKYSENYLFIHNSYMRPYFTKMILNDWNNENPDRKVSTLRIIYMKEVTGKHYRHPKPERVVLSEMSI